MRTVRTPPHSGHLVFHPQPVRPVDLVWRVSLRQVRDMFEALHNLERDLQQGRLRLVGPAVNQDRQSDWVLSAVMQIVVAANQNDETD